MRWILLTLSVVSIWVTIDAIRWKLGAQSMPFSAIASLWKGDLEYLSLAEREAVRQRYLFGPLGIGRLVWLFASVSAFLVIATVLEFLE